MSWINDRICDHLGGGAFDDRLAASRESFLAHGFAKISYVLPSDVKAALSEELFALLETESVRRDVYLAETSDTPRHMRNVTAERIRRDGEVNRQVYESSAFMSALQVVAAEKVLPCPYEAEQYVITHLSKRGDTHGWHWDDYSFALIYVAECPPVERGGFVQTVSGTQWNKTKPEVFRHLVERPIVSHELQAGDLYWMRADTTLHRVHPVEEGARRTIVNMVYAAERDLSKRISHETMENLFS